MKRLWHALFGHPAIEVDLRDTALSLAACATCGYVWPQISVRYFADLRPVPTEAHAGEPGETQ